MLFGHALFFRSVEAGVIFLLAGDEIFSFRLMMIYFFVGILAFFSYFRPVIIYFERGIFGFSFLFGGKCCPVEREPARCAGNKAIR